MTRRLPAMIASAGIDCATCRSACSAVSVPPAGGSGAGPRPAGRHGPVACGSTAASPSSARRTSPRMAVPVPALTAAAGSAVSCQIAGPPGSNRAQCPSTRKVNTGAPATRSASKPARACANAAGAAGRMPANRGCSSGKEARWLAGAAYAGIRRRSAKATAACQPPPAATSPRPPRPGGWRGPGPPPLRQGRRAEAGWRRAPVGAPQAPPRPVSPPPARRRRLAKRAVCGRRRRLGQWRQARPRLAPARTST